LRALGLKGKSRALEKFGSCLEINLSVFSSHLLSPSKSKINSALQGIIPNLSMVNTCATPIAMALVNNILDGDKGIGVNVQDDFSRIVHFLRWT